MDVHDQLDHLAARIRGAKAMPMSASCLVNRAEMLDIVQQLRDELPANLDQADAVLSERASLLAAGRERAERILAAARVEREQLIEQTSVLLAAQERAATLMMEAQVESTRLLADADGYVDRKLAEFEVFLGQLGSQVNNGRLRLTTRREAALAGSGESGQEPGQEPGQESGQASGQATGQEPGPGTVHGTTQREEEGSDVLADSGTPSDLGVAGRRGPALVDLSVRTR